MKRPHKDSPWFYLAPVLSLLFAVAILLFASGVPTEEPTHHHHRRADRDHRDIDCGWGVVLGAAAAPALDPVA
jgi:hypothetical protein